MQDYQLGSVIKKFERDVFAASWSDSGLIVLISSDSFRTKMVIEEIDLALESGTLALWGSPVSSSRGLCLVFLTNLK